ncbi:hypothetical protein D9756_002820 [Leucocoprinus leucothites]|uniref:F-box domain-containing protein n=1 Tax=Leucocoprinus leucothites TaxID=201217 RepID=A0A8H5GBJ1_9AGAR|nr:hypothetical protein D9756_002820 [Leucoagaricus leucothites]
METPREDECRFIESTLSHISTEVDALLAEKARLSRRLNTLRSRTSVLPPETLTAILEYACLGQHERSALASVCAHWYQVVHTTPSLWASVSLRYTRRNGVEFLLYHHRNAKCAPLSVELRETQRNGRPAQQESVIDPLFRTLLKDIAHDLRSLVFHGICPRLWSLIETYARGDTGFSQLEDLTLLFLHTERFQTKNTTMLFSGSRLNNVTLKCGQGIAGIEGRLPLDNVTKFDGWGFSSTYGMWILACCPKITTFKWEVSRWTQDFSDLSGLMALKSESPVVLPALETLIWKGGDVALAASIMQHLEFPSLQLLDWEEQSPSRDSPDYPNFRKSFFSSMPKLRTLKVDFNADTKEMVLPWLPSVENLEVRCLGREAGMLEFLLRRMASTVSNCLLPRLKCMTLLLRTTAPSELNALINMLEWRRPRWFTRCALLEEFTLRIKGHDITEVWQEHHIDAFKRMVQGGLKLEIWEDKQAPGRLLSL